MSDQVDQSTDPAFAPVAGSPAVSAPDVAMPASQAMPDDLRSELAGMLANEPQPSTTEGAQVSNIIAATSAEASPLSEPAQDTGWAPPSNIPGALSPAGLQPGQQMDMSKILRAGEKGRFNVRAKYIDPQVEVLDIASETGRLRYNEIMKMIADEPGKVILYEKEQPPHFMASATPGLGGQAFHAIVILKWTRIEAVVDRPDPATVVGNEQRNT